MSDEHQQRTILNRVKAGYSNRGKLGTDQCRGEGGSGLSEGAGGEGLCRIGEHRVRKNWKSRNREVLPPNLSFSKALKMHLHLPSIPSLLHPSFTHCCWLTCPRPVPIPVPGWNMNVVGREIFLGSLAWKHGSMGGSQREGVHELSHCFCLGIMWTSGPQAEESRLSSLLGQCLIPSYEGPRRTEHCGRSTFSSLLYWELEPHFHI